MTHYGSGGQSAYGGTAERPRFANFMLPWGVGLVSNIVLQAMLAYVLWEVIAGDDVTRFNGTGTSLLLIQLPSAICFALATWLAATVHRPPSRDSALRHCIAAFTPAVLLQLLVWAGQGSDLTTASFLAQVAVLTVGSTVGFLLDRLRTR
ncbi:hypothetical protein G5C51_24490 [Streptomyces sp. A7024]|uniref:Uncharacterized protein n=1 Tax=Streptomyces coryli TaxID=1128680 RepID=A0A6G4U4N7_9ACTN|nr:hypothetical protein [Streptomyces coryli]NGN67053.1 hypothetical protein [Streptomyces coryli]